MFSPRIWPRNPARRARSSDDDPSGPINAEVPDPQGPGTAGDKPIILTFYRPQTDFAPPSAISEQFNA